MNMAEIQIISWPAKDAVIIHLLRYNGVCHGDGETEQDNQFQRRVDCGAIVNSRIEEFPLAFF